jgi:nitronate monooxygenase
MKTAFTELLGLTTPIMQAPLENAATPELAAAVANAGALASLVPSV